MGTTLKVNWICSNLENCWNCDKRTTSFEYENRLSMSVKRNVALKEKKKRWFVVILWYVMTCWKMCVYVFLYFTVVLYGGYSCSSQIELFYFLRLNYYFSAFKWASLLNIQKVFLEQWVQRPLITWGPLFRYRDKGKMKVCACVYKHSIWVCMW